MRIRLTFSKAHFNGVIGTAHGPRTFPWYRPLGLSVVRLGVVKPSVGWRLWLYTNRGALYWDLIFDRRRRSAG